MYLSCPGSFVRLSASDGLYIVSSICVRTFVATRTAFVVALTSQIFKPEEDQFTRVVYYEGWEEGKNSPNGSMVSIDVLIQSPWIIRCERW